MARRHWLDPLARRLLIATGQIPAPAEVAARREAHRAAAHAAAVEQDLTDLKRARSAALPRNLVDVNRATASDWQDLPGCTPEQADLLVRLQAGGVQLSGPDDLQRLLRLDARTLQEWLPRLVFHWYGEPAGPAPTPVAINRADARELATRLALSPQRLERLLQERSHGPYRDLADLQQRLQLPAPLVESWIGRLTFDPPQAPPASGPSLPPTRSRAPRQGSRP